MMKNKYLFKITTKNSNTFYIVESNVDSAIESLQKFYHVESYFSLSYVDIKNIEIVGEVATDEGIIVLEKTD